MEHKDYNIIIEISISIILCVLIARVNSKEKINDFMLELLCEKPYIFLMFILVFVISLYTPLVAILFGIYIIVLDNNIVLTIKEKEFSSKSI